MRSQWPLEEARGPSGAFNLPVRIKCQISHSEWNHFPQTLCLQAFPFVYQLIPIKNFEHEGHSMLKKYQRTWEANPWKTAED